MDSMIDPRAAAQPHGVDAAPEDRPGVPMEAEPSPAEGAHWDVPDRQPGSEEHPHRVALELATPVVGTEHYARHWALLMFADRVDVLEDRLGSGLSAPLRDAGMPRLGARVERNPL